jgi:hypothetical protein
MADAEAAKAEAVDRSRIEIEKASAAYAEYAQGIERARAAQEAASNFTSKAPSEFKQIQDAAVGAAVAAGQFGDDMDRVAEVVVKTGGSMTVGAPMFFQIASASDEARASIRALIDEMNLLNDTSAKVFDVAKGWEDYLAALREGFNSGITSITSYIDQLNAFEMQLRQLFAGAGAEAKAGIEEVIRAIEALKIAALSGKDGGGGIPMDQLADLINKFFEKKPR